MSINDEERFPWLAAEKQFLREAIFGGVSVLGICLGAQLIAGAMGAKVYQNCFREIGWFPVRAVPAPEGNFLFPRELIPFHWHGETFDLPEGAAWIAESDGCANQGFQLNRNVIGLQFHLETKRENALALLDNCREDLIAGPYIQDEAELRAAPMARYQAANKIMNDVLSYLTIRF